jgi:putative flippase GtrA
MKNSIVQTEVDETARVAQNGVDEFSSVLTDLKEPSTAFSTRTVDTPIPAKSIPSYQVYPWSLPNRILDIVDAKTHGKAGQIQRVISYLFFGGVAALVNLGVFFIMYHIVLKSVQPDWLNNTLSYIVAAELSIIANFIPNDRFTFNTLPGAKRPWLQRCWRFHTTCIIGSTLTFLIETGLHNFTHTEATISEAIATLIVLVYNFTFHHLFTYRHIKHA